MPDLDQRWRKTCRYLGFRYTMTLADSGELLLTPMKPWLLKSALMTTLDRDDALLKIRIEVNDAGGWRIRQRLQ